MSRCFRILGLRENATKEQVTAAYERRMQRYKGADYADEPEYAHKKLMELKSAYEEAYRLAGTGGYAVIDRPVQREAVDSKRTSKKSSKPSKLRDAERKAAEHGKGEKFHQWLEQREEEKTRKKNKDERKKGTLTIKEKLKKVDLSKLKESLNELTSDDDDFDDFDGFDFDVNDSIEDTIRTDSGQRLGNDGTVDESKKESLSGEAIFKLVATLIAAVIALSGACEGEDITYDDEFDTAYDYIYNYEEIADIDRAVSDMASSTNALLYEEGEEGSSSLYEEEPLDYIEKADQFAKYYWNMDSLDQVTDYLFGAYAEYPTSSQESADMQLDCIFAFYEFLPLDEAIWYKNPYTDERIEGYADYLDYLNQYYDEINE